MKWYEILMAIPAIAIGAIIGIKMKKFKKDRHLNDSWKSRKK